MAKRRIIIPARYHSTRLPGKVLLDIAGKPMVQHVYERACQARFDSVVIATDHQQVKKVAEGFGATVFMTREDHPTGTDRAAEVAQKLGYAADDVIVGLQADEPLIPINNLQQVADNLANHTSASVATLCERITELEVMMNPNAVKVVRDHHNMALYFSRAPIPWSREHFPEHFPEGFPGLLHIGLYAYRGDFLLHYAELAKTALEAWEGLEQLRVLWHGYGIHVDLAKAPTPPGVDTQVGLDAVRQRLEVISEN